MTASADPKRLRILFIDDEDVPVVPALKAQGYDVAKIDDVDSLDAISDGRYHVIFFDVRGVGSKLGKNGLDIVKYVAGANPLIYRVVYSAKPFEPAEADEIRRYADLSLRKDVTTLDVIDLLQNYARQLSKDAVLQHLSRHLKLGWWGKTKLRFGFALTPTDVAKIAKRTGMAADAIKIASNCTTIAKSLLALVAV